MFLFWYGGRYVNMKGTYPIQAIVNVYHQGHIYPIAGNTYDIGTSANDIRWLYYYNMTDTSCADFSHLTVDELYELFKQIQPRKDNRVHVSKDKVFPHIDFSTLPNIFAHKAEKGFTKKKVPFLENNKIVLKNVKYKKGENCGIDMGAMVYAMKDLIVKSYRFNL